jgi:hypothetical protein
MGIRKTLASWQRSEPSISRVGLAVIAVRLVYSSFWVFFSSQVAITPGPTLTAASLFDETRVDKQYLFFS